MARRAFYSFHYKPDNWRASQIRNMGVVEGNKPATDNDWEDVKKNGTKGIQKWIDDQLKGKSVAIILIGENTAGRKWIKYEIEKAWNDGKGVLGIFIHNIKDSDKKTCKQGKNPFTAFTVGKVGLDKIVKAYNPPAGSAYSNIKSNLEDWIEEAIEIRANYG